MYVCSCHAIDDEEVRVSIRRGASTVEDVIDACSAGGNCGGCRPTIELLLDEAAAAVPVTTAA